MKNNIINILSIDLDILLSPYCGIYNSLIHPMDDRNYNWKQIENAIYTDDIIIDQEYYNKIAELFVQANRFSKIYIGYDHSTILNAIEDYCKDNTNVKFNITNIDYHHDIGYSDEQFNRVIEQGLVHCGSWIEFLSVRKLLNKYIWYRGQGSNYNQELLHKYNAIKPETYLFDKYEIDLNNTNIFYISLSLPWIPPKYTNIVFKLISDNIDDKKIEYLDGVYSSNYDQKPFLGKIFTEEIFDYNKYRNDHQLENIIVDDNIKLQPKTFNNCTSLQVADLSNIDNIPNRLFSGCSSLKNVILSNKLKTVGQYGFFGCKSLSNIKLPDNLQYIESHAFQKCSDLQEIIIPNNISIIEELTFAWCTSLTNVILPNNLKTINKYAFRDCQSLKQLYIPKSITHIDNYAFFGCNNLTLICDENNPYVINYCKLNNINCISNNNVILFEKNILEIKKEESEVINIMLFSSDQNLNFPLLNLFSKDNTAKIFKYSNNQYIIYDIATDFKVLRHEELRLIVEDEIGPNTYNMNGATAEIYEGQLQLPEYDQTHTIYNLDKVQKYAKQYFLKD